MTLLATFAFVAGLGLGVVGCLAVLVWQARHERPREPDAG